MTDHYEQALAHLSRADQARQALDAVYLSDPANRVEIARLNDAHRYALTVAKLHTNLAGVQATWDLRAEIERLFQDLNAPALCPACQGVAGRVKAANLEAVRS